MQEFNYAAECASLNFDLTNLADNLDFSWSGYNDSMMVFIYQTLSKLKEL